MLGSKINSTVRVIERTVIEQTSSYVFTIWTNLFIYCNVWSIRGEKIAKHDFIEFLQQNCWIIFERAHGSPCSGNWNFQARVKMRILAWPLSSPRCDGLFLASNGRMFIFVISNWSEYPRYYFCLVADRRSLSSFSDSIDIVLIDRALEFQTLGLSQPASYSTMASPSTISLRSSSLYLSIFFVCSTFPACFLSLCFLHILFLVFCLVLLYPAIYLWHSSSFSSLHIFRIIAANDLILLWI